jgi:hypothetical protein
MSLVLSRDTTRPWHFGINFIKYEKATNYNLPPASELFIYNYSIIYHYTLNNFCG